MTVIEAGRGSSAWRSAATRFWKALRSTPP